MTEPTTDAFVPEILMTRYWRPNTVCSVGEKLTRPETVGTFLNLTICAASAAPLVEPPARLMAVTTPSIAAAPVTKPPVPALTDFASLLTAGARVVPEGRGEGHGVVVRDALPDPVGAVTGPRVEDRRVVAERAHAVHEAGQLAERGRRHVDVGRVVVEPADGREHVVRPGRVRLVADDLAAELLEARLERLHDVLEVDEVGVGRRPGRLPALPPGPLRHGRALVLRDVAVAERERALGAEALRAHLVGADARGDREHALVDGLLHDGGREVDVAGGEDDVRALSEQAERARLRLGRIVVLRVAGDDLELHAAARVDLLHAHLGGRQGGIVEGRHVALAVEGPADHDLLSGSSRGSGHGRGHDERRHHHDEERTERSLPLHLHLNLLCGCVHERV